MSDTPRTDAAYKMTAKYGFYELFNECSKLERELNAFHTHLSAVMPPDFKDWHQNSKLEWPKIAAEVIQNLRIDRDKGWEMAAENKELKKLKKALKKVEFDCIDMQDGGWIVNGFVPHDLAGYIEGLDHEVDE